MQLLKERFIEAAGAEARNRNRGFKEDCGRHTPEKRRLPHHSPPGMAAAATSTQKDPGSGPESRSHSVHKMQCGKKQSAQQPEWKQSQRLSEKETQCTQSDTDMLLLL